MKGKAELSDDLILELPDEQVIGVLENNYIGSLAFIAHSVPYVLPVTYFYCREENCIVSYSMEGHKINALRENPQVALGVYEMNSVNDWRSVLVHGIYEELHQIDAKQYLHRFAEGVRDNLKETPSSDSRFIQDFSSRANSEGLPVVYRIKIEEWSGKQRTN